jgi:Gluconate 2-dehydrogenase subunit 3
MTEISRREAMQRLMAAIAAGVVVPSLLRAADWKPIFLDEKQDELLAAVAETMVPGSGTAQVDRFIDLLLSVDSAESKKAFLLSLGAVDKVASGQFQKSYTELNAGERDAAITSLSQEHKEAFANLKEWIAGAYYSSEQGMKELGWDGNFAFEKYPACEAVEGHS